VDGGIVRLLGLIASHRGAVEYDFRTRFGLGLSEVGARITITEAARLAHHLEREPSSWTFAAAQGWAYPLDRETLILADLLDRFSQVNFKKAKPYPRPWDVEGKTVQRHGDSRGRSRSEVVEILSAHARGLPV
jgi:hypothetical protein